MNNEPVMTSFKGFACTFLLIFKFPVGGLHNCNISKTIANCSGLDLTEIPKDLNPNIETLDLSSNPKIKLDSENLLLYKKLRSLKISNLANNSPVKIPIPSSLKNLATVDLTNTPIDFSSISTWPQSIKTLILDGGNYSKIVINNFRNIEILLANDNALHKFPEFYESAPLKTVDLRRNPLNSLEPVEIAPFCNIRKIGFEMQPNEGLQATTSFCNCHNLNQWLYEWKIDFSLLNCSRPDEMLNCSSSDEYEHQMLEKRKACLLRKFQIPPVLTWSFVILVLILVIILLAYTCLKSKSRLVVPYEKSSRTTHSPNTKGVGVKV